MAKTHRENYNEILANLREARRTEPNLGDVVLLAQIASESMQRFIDGMDGALNRELREIADYIITMKKEIGVFQANDIKNSRIPAAGQELDAVIRSTEDATNTIMECAEEIMATDATDLAAYQALVTDKVMQIFEACSFQDLTGQRVSKVVETLNTIEARVTRLVEAVNAKDVQTVLSSAEQKREERKESLMLNGPQHKGGGNDQSSVDRLFAAGGRNA